MQNDSLHNHLISAGFIRQKLCCGQKDRYLKQGIILQFQNNGVAIRQGARLVVVPIHELLTHLGI